MNKKNIDNKKQYIITVVFALFIVVSLCIGVQFELLYKCEKEVNLKELNTQNLYEFFTIEALEKQFKENPNDYMISIRLAQMYDSLGEFDKANEFFTNALSMSGRSNYSLYSYAVFCAKNDLYVFAATLAEQISGSNLRANYYKAKIYEHIANSLSKKGDYPASVKSYQIVYKYAKSIGQKSYIKEIKEKYANEYIKLADYHVSKNEIENGLADLNNSLKLRKTALALYKLGLIYIRLDDVKAEKYIHDAFEINPIIVNPYIYNSILNRLEVGDGNFYKIRRKNFETKLNRIYLYKDDVSIHDVKFLIKKNKFLGGKKYYLSFKIQNNTKINLESMDLKAEIYLNYKKYEIEKKLFSKAMPLKALDVSDEILVDLSNKVSFSNLDENNDATVKIFARKSSLTPYILLKIDLVNI